MCVTYRESINNVCVKKKEKFKINKKKRKLSVSGPVSNYRNKCKNLLPSVLFFFYFERRFLQFFNHNDHDDDGDEVIMMEFSVCMYMCVCAFGSSHQKTWWNKKKYSLFVPIQSEWSFFRWKKYTHTHTERKKWPNCENSQQQWQ